MGVRIALLLLELLVDPRRGLVVARHQSCEIEDAVETLRHSCGAAAAGQLAARRDDLARQIGRARQFAEISCRGAGRVECQVPATSECEPQYTLIFDRGALVALIERDDWQAPEAFRREVTERIEALLAAGARGCAETNFRRPPKRD